MPFYVKLIVILLSCISTALIYEDFMSSNFEKSLRGNYKVYFSFFVIIHCIVNLIGNTFINYMWSIMYIGILSFFFYNSKERNPIISMFILLVLFSIEETVVCYFLEWYFNHLSIPFDNFYYIAVFSSNIVLISLYKPIRTLLSKRKQNLNIQKNLLELFLLVLSFLCIILSSLFMKIGLPQEILVIVIFICLLIVCFDIYLVFVLDKIYMNQKIEEELKLVKLNQKINEAYYQSKMEQYNKQAKLFHDIKSHILTIEKLFENGEKDKAYIYASDLLKQMNYNSIAIHNKILRILLNDLVDNCASDKVELKHEIDSRVSYENINDLDLVAIYSNLFTNALEASKKCTSPFIDLKIYIHNDMVITSISNNYIGNINESNGILKSSKIKHIGIGLENIINTVNKYNGIYDIDYTNNIFTIKIILPLGE